MVRLGVRAAWLVVIGAAVVACSSPAPTSTAGAETDAPVSTADAFVGLPYRMDLPAGWIVASAETVDELLLTVEKTNPEFAATLEDSKPLQNQILAIEPALDLHMSVSADPFHRTAGATDSEALDEVTELNLGGMRGFPDLVQAPAADRVQLPVGEAARIRLSQMLMGSDGEQFELSTVGYLFLSGDTVFTIVVSTGAPVERLDEIEAIVETFQLQ